MCVRLLCAPFVEPSPSALNQAGLFTNNGPCVGPQLGYTTNSTLFNLVLGINSDVDIVLKGLTFLLVLHPIAAGLSLLSALPVFLSCCVFHNAPWIISLIFCIITAILSAIVFAADLALVIIARDRLADVTQVDLSISWGPGVWMVLAGMVCTWIALILLSAKVCRCCGYGCVVCSVKHVSELNRTLLVGGVTTDGLLLIRAQEKLHPQGNIIPPWIRTVHSTLYLSWLMILYDDIYECVISLYEDRLVFGSSISSRRLTTNICTYQVDCRSVVS